jgi:hypothetical protein
MAVHMRCNIAIRRSADAASAQTASLRSSCMDCIAVNPGGGGTSNEWACQGVAPGAAGYRNCTVSFPSCEMSGPCSPELQSVATLDADGVINRLASHRVASKTRYASLPGNGKGATRILVVDCGGTALSRTYSVSYAAAMRKGTARIAL